MQRPHGSLHIYNVREHRLAMAVVRPSHRHVFPLHAYLEPAKRLHGRLLRSTLSHHRTHHPTRRLCERIALIPQLFCKVDLALWHAVRKKDLNFRFPLIAFR